MCCIELTAVNLIRLDAPSEQDPCGREHLTATDQQSSERSSHTSRSHPSALASFAGCANQRVLRLSHTLPPGSHESLRTARKSAPVRRKVEANLACCVPWSSPSIELQLHRGRHPLRPRHSRSAEGVQRASHPLVSLAALSAALSSPAVVTELRGATFLNFFP